MKHLQRILVLALSAILVITACIPGALASRAVETPEATAPKTTAGTESTVPETTVPGTTVPGTMVPETTVPETTVPGTTVPGTTVPETTVPGTTVPETTVPETTVPGTTVPETGTAASEQPEAPMEQKPVSTDERYTVSFDLGGGILTARGVDRSVTAAPGETITLPGAPEKEDRTFTGWLSAKSGETYQAEAAYEVTDDDTLTAQWNMLQVLGVNTEPENSNTLSGMDCVVEAVSETEQESVESAVNTALGGDAVGALNVLAADISFLDESGRSLEPAEGETVPVTLTVPEGQIDEDAAFLVVYHMVEREDGSYFAEPVQYAPRGKGDQEISFGTTAFSIYAVAAVGKKAGDAGSVEIRTDGTGTVYYEIEEEQSKVFFFQDDNAANYTYHRYTWTVKDNNDTVRAYSTSIYFQDEGSTSDKKNSYQYPWLSLDALRPGVVTLAVDYYCYNGSDWWHPSGTVDSGTVEITLAVTEKENGLAIENNIPENGTLKPVWRDAASNVAPDHYVWTKEFYHTYNQGGDASEDHRGKGIIDDDALLKDGSINVAIDAGGIAQEQDSAGNDILCMKIYTCTAYDKDGNVLGTATHRVEYGEDVLNGSFEYPKIPSGSNYAFANGTRQLFWRSTAPGSGTHLGMDVELGNDTIGNPYLNYGGKANDGTQFAELNAEKVGILYQDVLTAPGATLSWSFGHRSRKYTGTNVMYLVIASTKDAQNVTNQAQINALVRNFQADGVSVSYNGGTYTMWKFEGNPDYWQDHSGSYTVPDGQYATRFFFASASGSTTGNLIDGIHFNEVQQYFIEYYLNGKLQEGLTQASHADLDSIITPANSGAEDLKNAVLTSSTINGLNYGGVTLSIKARKTVDAQYVGCRNVLRLYYTTGTASVRKIVEIEGWDDLSDEEKAVIWPDGYTASFQLYDGEQVVAKASMIIDLDEYAQKTAVAVFKDAGDPTKDFAPIPNHSYRVVEVPGDSDTANGGAHVYEQETTYDPVAEDGTGGNMRTDGSGTGSCTVKNSYRMVLTTLTIRKEGWETIDENQTFVYRVQGMDDYTKGKVDLTVTVHGNGSTTINSMPTGNYQVTEITSWSWRYTPTENTVNVNLDAPKTVTFTNKRAKAGDENGWRWLNGSSWADNRWLNGEKLGPEREEGSDQNG